MRLDKFLKSVGPVVAMAVAAAATSGCDGSKARFGEEDGVPLAELDLSGDAPDSINLVGPDTVRVTQGRDFTIALEGDEDAKARMRFALKDGRLSVMRAGDSRGGTGLATVTVTMPAPRRLVLAGSGLLHSEALARHAEVTIAGSGRVETPDIAVDLLEVEIAGSGSYRGSGTAESLDLSIAGSGDAEMKALDVTRAEISIAGSGNAGFSSDGEVKARIMGSGNVTVWGGASCSVSSFGSGTLTCKRSQTSTAAH